MSSDAGQLRAELAAAAQLPYGRPRSALVEGLVERAEALGDLSLARDARQELITSYSYGAEPLKRFGPFAWVLSRYDADPRSFDHRARYLLLWQFKWMTVGSVAHPGVPLDRIEQGLADMQDRYRGAGEGLAPYLGCRYLVDAHVHGEAASTEAYLAWVRAPRTTFSDCHACEPTDRANHLVAIGRFEDAVREAAPVLLNGGCVEQPQKAIAGVLEALLRTGDAERAAAEHLRGVRLMRQAPGETFLWARHLLVLARSGRLLRGLDLLEDHLGEVDDPPTPLDGMELAAAGARLLRGLADTGYGDLPLTVPAGWLPGGAAGAEARQPVADVAERLARTARSLAAQFDARNGTDAVGRRIASVLDADALPDLPLDRTVTRRTVVPTAGRPAHPDPIRRRGAEGGPDELSAPEGRQTPEDRPTPDQLVARFEESRRRQDAGLRRDVLRTWRQVRAEASGVAGADPLDAARLDAAVTLDDVTDDGADPHLLWQAAQRLRELGDPWLAGAHALAALRCEVEAATVTDPAGSAPDSTSDSTSDSTGDCASDSTSDAPDSTSDAPDSTSDSPGDDATAGATGEQLLTRLDALTAQVRTTCSAAQTGCLAVGVLGVLYAAAARGVLDPGTAQERIAATIRDGVGLLESVPRQELTVAERGGLAMLVAQEASGLESGPRLERLRVAWGLLEAGERAQERAVVGLEVAGSMAETGELAAALDVLAEVAGDGETADIPALSARALAMSARIHRALRRPEDAVRDFVRAEQWLQVDRGRHADTGVEELAAVRRDLAFALQESGRPLESAEVAETAVDVLEEELGRLGLRPAPELPAAEVDLDALLTPRGTAPHPGPEAADQDLPEPLDEHAAAVRLAGTLRYAAAEACAALEEGGRAAGHARMSARWHRACGWGPAEAEALALAGQTEPDQAEALPLLLRAAALYDAEGRWDAASRCRRIATGAALDAHGLPLARRVIGAARTALDTSAPEDGEGDRHRWEGYALTEQTARVLARGGEAGDALTLLDGLEIGYRELGDLGSVWDVALLRAECLDDLNRTEEGLGDLEAAAEEALRTGAPQRARQLGGRLAGLLDELGRPDDAEAAWQRFSGGTA